MKRNDYYQKKNYSYNPEHKCCVRLVEKFCKNPPNWAIEIKTAKKLLRMCPDLDAWLELTLLFPINSLLFFLTPQGKQFIPASKNNPYFLDVQKLTPTSGNNLDVI